MLAQTSASRGTELDGKLAYSVFDMLAVLSGYEELLDDMHHSCLACLLGCVWQPKQMAAFQSELLSLQLLCPFALVLTRACMWRSCHLTSTGPVQSA